MHALLIAGLLFLSLLLGAVTAPAAQPRSLSPEAAAQIEALLAEKASRSPVQRKIGSQLLYAARMARGQAAAPGVPYLRTTLEYDAAGRVAVDVRADVRDDLLEALEALGGSVVDMQPSRGTFRAWLELDRVEDLAAHDAVHSVLPAGLAFLRKIDTSEGDAAHRADELRTAFGVDGTGVSVGVLSDGVDSIASLEA